MSEWEWSIQWMRVSLRCDQPMDRAIPVLCVFSLFLLFLLPPLFSCVSISQVLLLIASRNKHICCVHSVISCGVLLYIIYMCLYWLWRCWIDDYINCFYLSMSNHLHSNAMKRRIGIYRMYGFNGFHVWMVYGVWWSVEVCTKHGVHEHFIISHRRDAIVNCWQSTFVARITSDLHQKNNNRMNRA